MTVAWRNGDGVVHRIVANDNSFATIRWHRVHAVPARPQSWRPPSPTGFGLKDWAPR